MARATALSASAAACSLRLMPTSSLRASASAWAVWRSSGPQVGAATVRANSATSNSQTPERRVGSGLPGLYTQGSANSRKVKREEQSTQPSPHVLESGRSAVPRRPVLPLKVDVGCLVLPVDDEHRRTAGLPPDPRHAFQRLQQLGGLRRTG